MEFEVSYSLEDEQQFWAEIEDILSTPSQSHEAIDNALRSFIAFTTNFKDEYLCTEYEVAKCAAKLQESALFKAQQAYVRRQLVYGLLQEDEAATLHLITAILLYDGRAHEDTFEMMQQECAFPRLVELIQRWGDDRDVALHRLLLELMYEMSRIQRLTWEDLASVDDAFVMYLFGIIESVSSDASDPYHYPVIRVLLVLNEQYMVSNALQPPNTSPLTNRILKAISTHLLAYKTFGENLILLLNRESETSLQLLILKLLYLLFSTKQTAEYFYTNDLHVLLDVILRNLLDLPAEDEAMQALRHTYLRVLFPLLANSQLRRAGMGYKCTEIRQVLRVLGGDVQGPHFAPVDATTVRLVQRCRTVPWIAKPDEEHAAATAARPEAREPPPQRLRREDSNKAVATGPLAGDGSKELAKRSLGISIPAAQESTLSVLAVAEHTEKPGVLTPSRAANAAADGEWN